MNRPVPAFATDWIVLKFGGTSVSKKSRWDTIATLMRRRADEDQARVLVVVSALSGVTNALQAMIDGHADGPGLSARAEVLIERHLAFAAELGLDPSTVLGPRCAALRALATDPRAAHAELPWQAELLAQGELLSSTLGAAYLRTQGMALAWWDARDAMRAIAQPNASAWAQHLSVSCDFSDPVARERLIAGPERFAITQGFIARAADGDGTAILGRGGSDTSAACFGALLKARRVEIWTDVPGMFSANPRQVPDARLLSRLDFAEAQEIATTGAKVLHPRCLTPCREAGVPMWIRDTENPELAGTVIDDQATTVAGVKAISARRGIVLVSMETVGMWQQVGFLAEVFGCFKTHGLSVDLIGSAETNVTVSLDPSDNLVSTDVLEALCRDLERICRVKVIAPCAAITLVGRGMRSRLHRLTEVLAAFGRERVHLISQSSNDLNLTFVVDEALAEGLLPTLHALLIASNAMPIDETAVFGPSWRELGAPRPPRSNWWQAERERLIALAGRGTPTYAYHLPTVRERARQLKTLKAVDRAHYALKANPHPVILRALEAEGLGFECVSLAEVEHVLATLPGLDPKRVLFTPSFAPRVEFERAFEHGVHLTLDNPALLAEWPEVFRGRELTLRVDPGFGSGHHDKVRTGGKEAKFGMPLDEAAGAAASAKALGARVTGLHAHIGSGIFDANHWREVYARLASVADAIGTVERIDVGGGIGIPYQPESEPFDMAAFGAMLAEMKAVFPQYALLIEPGRFLVAEAGVLLTRVTSTMHKQGVRRVGLDAGMNALLRPALYNAWHGIVNLSRLDDPPGEPAEVVGPICETGDVLGRRRRLPEATAEGDVVLLVDAGAYGRVMASRYNLRALPAEEILE
ncbi:bifunctional aspartate kinase/diaminopimelate decarboxylase [Silanimonas sp.]|uniref:bifunctional aspartate kinase/diaminopimelate decarboxylase n=1 Tax=Silanimonas sp. TaxID=1929290 RepID=UPI001BC757F2|nr:bifunctional aspartate kinase/diaminopimelate decarboxylase [Silanimonas sp.]MBS3896412.1 bifunctional aspartate kinase/diaminopimelate decarboxylase [Silanimonas sp.]MBS3924504.1 bifunctional aspartate kinase/diaminopimelate decarboxylase [Xanthomonadaceae bacterium]